MRINLKNFDQSGFDFLLYFVRNFTETIKETYKKWVKKHMKNGLSKKEAEEIAFIDFVEL